MKRSIKIPFDGFYQSITDMCIDREIEYYLEAEGLSYDDVHIQVDFEGLARDYVKAYREWLEDNGSPPISLSFEELNQPREYNFTTDRIYCAVDLVELLPYYRAFITNPEAQKIIEAHFKSRDGFISFYGDFVDEWRELPLEEWDYNQLSVLLPEPDYYELWEGPSGNGVFNNYVSINKVECK